MRPRPGVAVLLVAIQLALLAGCGRGGVSTGDPARLEPGGPERISATTAAHLERTFDELLGTVETNYVYGVLRGLDWRALGAEYGSRVRSVRGIPEFSSVVREMLTEIGDPEVIWQSRDERISVELGFSATTQYEGIGTYIGFRAAPVPRVIILEVIPGSPAERAGLRAHDAILSIEGSPVRADEATTVAQRIRGPRGTPVRLLIKRPGAGSGELSVTRERVSLSNVVYPTRAGRITGTSVGYILLPRSAANGLKEEIAQIVGGLSEGGRLDGLLLDLRISGSGAFPLVDLLSLFANGRLGTTYTAGGSELVEVQGEDREGSQTLPLAVLVGPDTEGLAEIFAAALQGTGRAIVVGTRTPGTVEANRQFALADGSRLWLPVSAYRAPSGAETGLQGVIPDLPVSVDWDEVTEAADAVRNAAAAALKRGSRL